MRGEVHKEPPPDIEFPYFEVNYYDQPESVGITIKATDARSKRWPECSQTIDSDGSINIWEHGDEDTQHSWRQKLGEFLTDRFLLADSKLSVHLQPMIGRRCFLNDFPPGYKLFKHTKDGRIDNYLFGSKHVNVFRSPQEFFLHAWWLMAGADMNSDGSPVCMCKYCGPNRHQGDIDREYQLPGHRDSGHKGSGRHGGSAAATSETIIMQAKDYRNLKKPSTGLQQTASKGVESIDPALL